MLIRKYRVMAAATLVLVLATPLIAFGSASATTTVDPANVTAANAGGQKLTTCPSAFHLVKKVQMRDGAAHASPGVIWIYLGPGNESACAVVNRLNQANGVGGNTAITIETGGHAIAHQDAFTRYFVGPITIQTPGCFEVRGAMQLGSNIYKWNSGQTWCGNKDPNYIFNNEPKDNPRTVTQTISWAKNQINNPSHSWHNICLTFVAQAYGWSYSGIGTPHEQWNALPASKKHAGDTNPPAGALVYFDTSNPAGHIAISLGGGNIISSDAPTDNGSVGIVSLAWFKSHWPGSKYDGWSEPYFPAGG